MKSHELLRDVFKKSGAKKIASSLKLSLATVHKWSRPRGADGSGILNPLDRVAELIRHSGDLRPLHWLCEQSGGYFVANARPAVLPPKLLPAENATVREFGDLISVMAGAAKDGGISQKEAAVIRSRWEKAKSVMEGFVQACERDVFRHGIMLWTFWLWFTTGEVPELTEVS